MDNSKRHNIQSTLITAHISTKAQERDNESFISFQSQYKRTKKGLRALASIVHNLQRQWIDKTAQVA